MINNTPLRRHISFVMVSALLFVTVVPPSAVAGIVGTGQVIAEQAATMDRDRLLEELNRVDVREQLQGMGVNAAEAVERVAAMTDAEVRELTAGLELYPAGADVSLAVILLLVIIFLIVR